MNIYGMWPPLTLNRRPPVDEHDFFEGKYLPAVHSDEGVPADEIEEAQIVEAPKITIDVTVVDLSEEQEARFADGKDRQIRYIAATTYWSHDGRPITAQEFMAQLFGDLGGLVASEDELRQIWSDPERREGFIERLTELGYDSDRMEDMRRLIDAPHSDIFDVLAYVRFTLVPMARAQRAGAARSSGLGGYKFEMRQFLDYVLQAYETHGVEELSLRKIRDFLRIRYGGTNDAKAALGSVAEIRKAFIDIQGHLFR